MSEKTVCRGYKLEDLHEAAAKGAEVVHPGDVDFASIMKDVINEAIQLIRKQ
jgi:hypothetical protein